MLYEPPKTKQHIIIIGAIAVALAVVKRAEALAKSSLTW